MTPAPALAQPEVPADGPEIVVTARSIEDTRRALEACLARDCPPDEDIDATLGYAENLFVGGAYQDARSALLASIRRNGKQAKAYPEPVADLNRATARVAAHLGRSDEYYRYSWGILRALNDGIPAQDVRHFGARLEVAEMMTSMRGSASGRTIYRALARDARAAGRPDIAAFADLRATWFDYLAFPQGTARKELMALARSQEPGTRNIAFAARILLARIERDDGRNAATDALIAEMAAMGFRKPTLLHAPHWEVPQLGGSFDDKWIDVGFWVQPDGRVSDVELLRKSNAAGWAEPLLRSIAGRLYSPTDPEAGGVYRVERYTYTARWNEVTESRIKRRSDTARIEYLDLTIDPPAS